MGATLVGGPAGDVIIHVASAMQNGTGLKDLGSSVHPYPTYGEVFRGYADGYNKTLLTPSKKSFIKGLLDFKK